jgi:hypothetical protein
VYGAVGNIWSRQSKLLAKDGTTSDYFGVRVSIYDTAAMIGAFGDDDKASDAGILVSVFVSCFVTLLHYNY